jgi:hypothetical protein
MPPTDQVTDAGALEYKEQATANGRVVRKIVGFRPGFTYTYDFVTALITLLRTGTFFTVGYFDLDGTEQSETFSVSYPSFSVFKFDSSGTAVWTGCTLTIKAQEVS